MTSKEVMLELLGFAAFQVPIEKQEEWKEMLHTLQNDLDELEKLKKAFEILKKKRLSLVYFVYEIRADKNERNYLDYKYWAFNKVKSKNDLLTEDQFNLLLKEVFKCS